MPDFVKDPGARVDFAVDWSAWLGEDTITDSSWDPEDGLTVDDHDHDGQVTRAWVTGGTAVKSYALINRITTAGGRVDERTLRITVTDR